MLAFDTLLLGLVFGTTQVRVLAGPPVVAVELQLDGASVGTRSAAPWAFTCDFGAGPMPHELLAVGRDSSGQAVSRVSQLVNIPRPPAEVQLTFVRGEPGRAPLARLSWDNARGEKPTSLAVSFDGRSLDVDDPHAIRLPQYDPAQAHMVSAELWFPDDSYAHAEAVLGGEYTAATTSELTAVPVVVDEGHELPPLGDLQGLFLARQDRPRVVAVDSPPAEVVLVLEPDTRFLLGRMKQSGSGSGDPRNPRSSAQPKPLLTRSHHDRLVALFAAPSVQLSARIDVRTIFPMTKPFSLSYLDDPGFYETAPSPQTWVSERLADAVAVAGVESAAHNYRRAVVVLLQTDRTQEGAPAAPAPSVTPEKARAYLAALRVPLFVWSVTPPGGRAELSPELPVGRDTVRARPVTPPGGHEVGNPWGQVRDASSAKLLRAAAKQVRQELDRQRIVWLEGRYLPSEVHLASSSGSFHLAGAAVPDLP